MGFNGWEGLPQRAHVCQDIFPDLMSKSATGGHHLMLVSFSLTLSANSWLLSRLFLLWTRSANSWLLSRRTLVVSGPGHGLLDLRRASSMQLEVHYALRG